MTDEKFQKFQDTLLLTVAYILLMHEDNFLETAKEFTDKDGKEYARKATKRIKEDKQFARNVKGFTGIITLCVRDFFKENE